MKRQMKRIPVGQTQMRYIVILTGDDLELYHGDMGRRMLQAALLRAMVDQPDLMLCGTEPFHKLSMSWKGNCWIAELEATVNI
jgi:hypothetical protein